MKRKKANKATKRIIIMASLCAGLITTISLTSALSYANNMHAEIQTQPTNTITQKRAMLVPNGDKLSYVIVEARDGMLVEEPVVETVAPSLDIPTPEVPEIVSAPVELSVISSQVDEFPEARMMDAEIVEEKQDEKAPAEPEEIQPEIKVVDASLSTIEEVVEEPVELQIEANMGTLQLDSIVQESEVLDEEEFEVIIPISEEEVSETSEGNIEYESWNADAQYDYTYDEVSWDNDITEIPVDVEDYDISDDYDISYEEEFVPEEIDLSELDEDIQNENIIPVSEDPSSMSADIVDESLVNIEELSEIEPEAESTEVTAPVEILPEETAEEPVQATESIPSVASNGVGSQIVEYAAAQVGVTPYVNWYDRMVDGMITNSLETGTDCSGFVSLIYGEAGIDAPTGSDAYQDMSNIEYDDLEPGDVVVYRNGGHVAIYAGDDTIIHCSNEIEGTKVSDMFYDEPTGYVRLIED